MERSVAESAHIILTKIVDFSFDSAFHGIQYIANASQRYLFRFIWLIVVITANFICLNLVTSTYEEVVVNKPKVTDIRVVRTEQLRFPQVVICPASPDNREIKSLYSDELADVMLLIGGMAFNPFFGSLRRDLRENLTEAFDNYPNMERMYSEFSKELTTEVQSFYSEHLFELKLAVYKKNKQKKQNC